MAMKVVSKGAIHVEIKKKGGGGGCKNQKNWTFAPPPKIHPTIRRQLRLIFIKIVFDGINRRSNTTRKSQLSQNTLNVNLHSTLC